MKKKPIILLVSIFFFLLLQVPVLADEILIASSHQEAVTGLGFHQAANCFVSASMDGTIRTWTQNEQKLSAVIPITEGNILQIAFHPSQAIIAAIVRDLDGAYRISVVNVCNQSILYSIALESNPIYMTFSPQGTYLAYSLPRINSLYIHSAASGQQRRLLRSVEGIMNFFTFSRSESNIMTYQAASGEITYYNVQSGRNISYFASAPGIEYPTMLGIRYLTGIQNGKLIVVDAVSGRTIANAPLLAPVKQLITSQERNAIGVITAEANRSHIEEYIFSGEELLPSERTIRPSNIQFANYSSGDILFADMQQQLLYLTEEQSDARRFQAVQIAQIRSVTASGNQLYISTDRHITAIESDIFNQAMATTLTMESMDSVPNVPDREHAGLTALPSGEILIWPIDTKRDMTISRWLPQSASLINTSIQIESPIQHIHADQDQILFSTQNGNIFEYGLPAFEQRVQLHTANLQTAIHSNTNIIAGKNNSNGDTSMLIINPETLETVPINDPALMVFALETDTANNLLYSLAYVEVRGNPATVLRVHRSSSPARSRVIHRFNGEDLGAILYFDQANERLYTNFGQNGLVYWNGSRFITIDENAKNLRAIGSAGPLVYAINTAGKLLFWNASSSQYLGELNCIDDGSWVLLSSFGSFISSGDFDAAENLSIQGRPETPLSEIEQLRTPFPCVLRNQQDR